MTSAAGAPPLATSDRASAAPDLHLEEDAPLAPLTTLGVGGAARWLARVPDAATLRAALRWAAGRRVPVFVLGGGSNLLVADSGFDGLVVQQTGDGIELVAEDDRVVVRAEGGGEWDALVARCVAEGLAGMECLSGIPGQVGAAPMQNIGAYGQEVAESIVAVHAIDRRTGEAVSFRGDECGFAYRHSHFKGPWRDRYVIVAVDFGLQRRATGTVRYPDLRRRFGLADDATAGPPLAEVREGVRAVRAEKSMLLADPEDPNRRSAGSFFVNPVVSAAEAEAVRRRAAERTADPMPAYPASPGSADVKLSAAWLIERAGFHRGHRRGRAALSSRHTLALTNQGDATAAEIVALAAEVRRGVREAFGVTLSPEPVFLGFDREVDELLREAEAA